MYYRDFSEYEYWPELTRLDIVNIGWLQSGHGFPKSPSSREFLDALWRLTAMPFLKTRGYHFCDLCPNIESPIVETYSGESVRLGSAEIRAVGANGRVFAAPDLLFHYVREHNYDPPLAFKEAVFDGARDIDQLVSKAAESVNRIRTRR